MIISKWVIAGLPYDQKSIETIFEMILVDLGSNIHEIHSRSRLRQLIDKKTKIVYLLHRVCGFSSSEVGKIIGYDHATVLHHCNKCEGLMCYDEGYLGMSKLKYKYLTYKKGRATIKTNLK